MKKILLAIVFLSGCSSRPINPIHTPNYERLSAIKDQVATGARQVEKLSDNEEVAKNYLEAMKAEVLGNKKDACKLFQDLAENRDFPLNQTALVHTLSDCDLSKRELKNLWEDTQIANYLKETYYDYSLRLAEKFKLEEFIADFSYELAPFKSVQAEKVQLLKKAIFIAQKLNKTDEEAKYFQKLTEVSPQHSLQVTKENTYAIAKDFESSRQFEKARSMYLDIINGDYTLEEKVKAYNAYRMSFKVARNLKAFLEKTGEMEVFLRGLLDSHPDDVKIQEAWVDAKVNYARAVWTEHMNAEARAILDEIIKRKVGSDNQLANIYWIYGSLHVESKENKEALVKFEKAADYKSTSLDQQENIQWAIVWNKYLTKKYKNVIADADKFIVKSSNPNFINKLKFWKARSLLKRHHGDEAFDIFTEVAANDPFGYYGLISAMEIKVPLKPLPPTQIITDPIGNFVLDWLIAMDEKNYSMKVLKEMNPQFKTIAEKERAMSLYAQSGWYQGGMSQIYNFPVKMRDEITAKYISVIFPTPYKDIFFKYSDKYNLPRAFSFAITRQESAFNPTVRSWADAFGLMQMIPEKASELSKKYSIAYKGFNDLYKPETNVEMGVALLSELHKKYKGKFAQSVAAYNASTNVISVWEKERFNGDYLEFIEMIPYEETRNYIKLVFRNFMTYKRVLSNEEILIPENFFATSFN
jgi:soluble lytic murein transglycosylase